MSHSASASWSSQFCGDKSVWIFSSWIEKEESFHLLFFPLLHLLTSLLLPLTSVTTKLLCSWRAPTPFLQTTPPSPIGRCDGSFSKQLKGTSG